MYIGNKRNLAILIGVLDFIFTIVIAMLNTLSEIAFLPWSH
jgi:hypothetical protein